VRAALNRRRVVNESHPPPPPPPPPRRPSSAASLPMCWTLCVQRCHWFAANVRACCVRCEWFALWPIGRGAALAIRRHRAEPSSPATLPLASRDHRRCHRWPRCLKRPQRRRRRGGRGRGRPDPATERHASADTAIAATVAQERGALSRLVLDVGRCLSLDEAKTQQTHPPATTKGRLSPVCVLPALPRPERPRASSSAIGSHSRRALVGTGPTRRGTP
jgi:hypothetical protein